MATREELRRLRLFMDLGDAELDELLPRWTELEQPRGAKLTVHGSPGFGFRLDHRGRSATVVPKTPVLLQTLSRRIRDAEAR
jgi:hypothetical protein